MDIFNSPKLDLYNRASHIRSAQIEAISSNIANENTPGYKAKQVSFESMVQLTPSVNKTHVNHISISAAETEVMTSENMKLDGNTVDGLQERMNFSEVAGHYQVIQQFIASDLSGLKKSFKGRD